MTESFPRQYARTRRFSVGAPRNFVVGATGERIAFLRSRAPGDPANALFVLDAHPGSEYLIADPATIASGADQELPAAERARRERERESGAGIVAYDADPELTVAVFALGGRLYRADLIEGAIEELDAVDGAFDPRLSTDGHQVGYVVDSALRCTGPDGDREVIAPDAGEANVGWGSAEFVAGEEMGRTRGFWWGPDDRLLVQRTDVSAVPVWHIAAPVDPAAEPAAIRYPHAGATNAEVGLSVISRDGARVDIDWAGDEFEYLANASWGASELITLTVQTRDQKTLAVLTADPGSGAVTERYRQRDDHWVELVPGAPAWIGERLLSVVDHTSVDDNAGTRRLELDGEPISPDGLQVRRVLAASEQAVWFSASPDPTETHVYRSDLTGGIEAATEVAGVHGAAIRVLESGETVAVVSTASLDRPGSMHRVVRWGADAPVEASTEVATVVSHAEQPVVTPNVALVGLGPNELASAILFPAGDDGSTKLPVLLDPYGGPHAQRVQHAQSMYLTSQWFADQGFAVIVTDGRGTPARGPVFERAVYGDLATPVLDDQVAALEAAAELHPRLDLDRVAIRGWSFGGYLAALAVLRRPDRFHAAIAGAPVTDWALYDTHYTERYLGHPETDPGHYSASSLIEEAAALTRPLLLVHGLADDNVVAAHTLQLSRALLEAGRPHQVLPLSGVTHMTPQEAVAENLLLLQIDFLRASFDQ